MYCLGHIERKYIKVPIGASWVEATMRTSGFDTARRFFVDTVQISPLQRPMKWESVITFSCPSTKSFAFPVEGGRTMELVIAQFWSSGIGSHEATVVEFEEVGGEVVILNDEVIGRDQLVDDVEEGKYNTHEVLQALEGYGSMDSSDELTFPEDEDDNNELLEEDFDPKLIWLFQDDEVLSSSCARFTEVLDSEKALDSEKIDQVERRFGDSHYSGSKHTMRPEGEEVKKYVTLLTGTIWILHFLIIFSVFNLSQFWGGGGATFGFFFSHPSRVVSTKNDNLPQLFTSRSSTIDRSNPQAINMDNHRNDLQMEIGFHGININKEEVVLDGSDAPVRMDAEALLSSEKLAPAAILSKRVYTMGDVYPNSTKLPKGEYKLQLYLRHDNVQYLEKMKQLVLFIERNLEDKVGSIKHLISRCGDGFHKEELL
ncbi:hypothetical protein TEA_021254 [Camellia sinensis var. sinensis]|uniref:Uncharacterized protein n=1 Tax=Camellia sinensis var. sinensis TaxID=542762 RepID=A0A4V3WL59_CAMSN|nr:hypothetical protein TEA_021254 [Camellia sinensis var. sinensis]